ncbi:MAG TPA: PCRF domain-containing protein, partial [Clostridia bacterium]|nr:PCRF domain-containing protein [Clostridia bacterium]
MLEKLEFILEKYQNLNKKISDPEIINDQPTWQKYIKEHAEIEPIVAKYKEYKKVKEALDETNEIIRNSDDEELREMAKMELPELEEKYERMSEEIKFMLIPKDPNDEKNVIVEIRAGAGGDEAGLFAAEIFRMYVRYAERNRWKTDIMNTNETGVGGLKEVVFMIKGNGAYSKLKYESGVHRVQRIPQTESGGRIHTST